MVCVCFYNIMNPKSLTVHVKHMTGTPQTINWATSPQFVPIPSPETAYLSSGKVLAQRGGWCWGHLVCLHVSPSDVVLKEYWCMGHWEMATRAVGQFYVAMHCLPCTECHLICLYQWNWSIFIGSDLSLASVVVYDSGRAPTYSSDQRTPTYCIYTGWERTI